MSQTETKRSGMLSTIYNMLPGIDNDYAAKLVYTLEDKKQEFDVRIEDGVYVVDGPAIERLLARVNMEDNESLYYFQKSIKNLGVEDRLKEMGIKEGDTVKFIIWEFVWYN